MASSTLEALTGEAPAAASKFYHVKSPYGSGDDRECTGTQFRQGLAVPWTVYAQGLPMIYASSGTMTGSPNGTGAFTGLTAITGTNVPTRCLMYFPANTVNASGLGSAAGWYFCTLATTSTGNVIDTTPYTPSSTPPVWPSSPSAPTTATTWTSTTATVTAITFDVPANALGLNGSLEVGQFMLLQTNNANAKSWSLTFGAMAATGTISTASSGGGNGWVRIANTGSAAIQNSHATLITGGFAATAVGAVDTTAAVTVTLSLTKGTATDNVEVGPLFARVIYGA